MRVRLPPPEPGAKNLSYTAERSTYSWYDFSHPNSDGDVNSSHFNTIRYTVIWKQACIKRMDFEMESKVILRISREGRY